MKENKNNKLKTNNLESIAGAELGSFTIPSEEAVEKIKLIWRDTLNQAYDLKTDPLVKKSLLEEADRIETWLEKVIKTKIRLQREGWEIVD